VNAGPVRTKAEMSFSDTWKNLFSKPYAAIGPREAEDLVLRRGAVLLDVREQYEWASGHAPSARNIPVGALGSRLADVSADRPVVAICQSGMRSARAARLLGHHGYEAYNLRGGMTAWANAGLPVTTTAGRAK
jgi:rhodanese-related sulfurtransferase